MSLTRSYARALLEAAQEMNLKSNDLDQIQNELNLFVTTMNSHAELSESLSSPVVPADKKAEISQELTQRLGFSKLASNFIALVAKKNRVSFFQEMADAFLEARLQAEGAMMGSVVSADPLQKTDLEELATSFTKKFGKKIVFKAAVDPSLLAGLKVTVNGVTYDGSLRSQLHQLRDRLVYGKSPAFH